MNGRADFLREWNAAQGLATNYRRVIGTASRRRSVAVWHASSLTIVCRNVPFRLRWWCSESHCNIQATLGSTRWDGAYIRDGAQKGPGIGLEASKSFNQRLMTEMEHATHPVHVDAIRDLRTRVERIRQLWTELDHTEADSPQFAMLIEQIRAESDVYRALLYQWRTT